MNKKLLLGVLIVAFMTIELVAAISYSYGSYSSDAYYKQCSDCVQPFVYLTDVGVAYPESVKVQTGLYTDYKSCVSAVSSEKYNYTVMMYHGAYYVNSYTNKNMM